MVKRLCHSPVPQNTSLQGDFQQQILVNPAEGCLSSTPSSGLMRCWHGSRVATRPNIATAIRTKFVTGIYPTLAMGTGGMQRAAASRTKAEAGLEGRAALGTVQDARLAQNEIEDD